MNCNPNGAFHYIKTDFIDRAEEIGMYRLHFTMEDNLTLSDEIRRSYAASFRGVFYQQYILGEWVNAEGAVYPMWDDQENTRITRNPDALKNGRRVVAIDYGTVNPCVFLDARDDGENFYIVKEYYWDSVKRRRQKTDAEYARDLLDFLEGDRDALILVDPSAASFKTELRNRGFRVQDAKNQVREGIAATAVLIAERRLVADREKCPNLIREMHSYVWDAKAGLKGEERPLKERDHAMDAMRYLVHTLTSSWRRRIQIGRKEEEE